MPLSWSWKKIKEIDDEFDWLLAKSVRLRRLIGMSNHSWASSGGCSYGKHHALLTIQLRLGHVVGRRPYLDAGCSVGNSCIALKERFPRLKYIGVDCNGERLSRFRERLNDWGMTDGTVELKELDWVATWDQPECWGFLSSEKYFVYFNNFNMGGEVNEYFQKMILKHAMIGTVIVAYFPLFIGNREHCVKSRVEEMWIDETHFTWVQHERVIKVYVYELLMNIEE